MKSFLVFTLLMANTAWAATGSETWSVGALGGLVTSNQADLNQLITNANTRAGGISTSQLGNSYEIGGYLQRRLNGSIVALQLRPSYYWNSAKGSGTGGTYSYSVSGFTVTPQLKVYLLESPSTKLFIQGGVGWGTLSTTIQEGSASASFSGSNFGFQGGIGVNFCFGQRDQHCLVTEANARYMSIDRNLVSSSSGYPVAGSPGSLAESTVGTEAEINGHDLATNLSGIQAFIGYQFNI